MKQDDMDRRDAEIIRSRTEATLTPLSEALDDLDVRTRHAGAPTPFQLAARAARSPRPEPVDLAEVVPLAKFVRLSSQDDGE